MRLANALLIFWEVPMAEGADPHTVITGQVLETIDASRYTYIHIQTSKEAVWTAVPQVKMARGETASVIQSLVMKDFHSKTLDRVFPTVVFGVLAQQTESQRPGTLQ